MMHILCLDQDNHITHVEKQSSGPVSANKIEVNEHVFDQVERALQANHCLRYIDGDILEVDTLPRDKSIRNCKVVLQQAVTDNRDRFHVAADEPFDLELEKDDVALLAVAASLSQSLCLKSSGEYVVLNEQEVHCAALALIHHRNNIHYVLEIAVKALEENDVAQHSQIVENAVQQMRGSYGQ